MKKFNLIFNIVILVAIAVLFILHFTSGKKGLSTSLTSDKTVNEFSGSIPIAYINIDTLLNNIKMYSDLQDEMNKKQQTLEASFASKYRTFEQSVNQFQNEVNKGLLTRSEMQLKDQQLANEKLNLENLHNQYLQQLQDEGLVSHRKVINYIVEYLEEYNKEMNLQYIFSYSFGSNLLYADDNLDITNEIINGLNNKYDLESKAKK